MKAIRRLALLAIGPIVALHAPVAAAQNPRQCPALFDVPMALRIRYPNASSNLGSDLQMLLEVIERGANTLYKSGNWSFPTLQQDSKGMTISSTSATPPPMPLQLPTTNEFFDHMIRADDLNSPKFLYVWNVTVRASMSPTYMQPASRDVYILWEVRLARRRSFDPPTYNSCAERLNVGTHGEIAQTNSEHYKKFLARYLDGSGLILQFLN